MGLRPTKGDEDAPGRSSRINGLCRVFKGVPMGLRPTKGDEDAPGRSSRINGLCRVFNGAVFALGTDLHSAVKSRDRHAR